MSATTFAMRIKEIMGNMPDTLNTKKEIDEYFKNAMKDIKDSIKENKTQKAPAKKRTKKVEVDEDGNDIVKAKRPLNQYQKFIQDNRAKVKEENPTLNGEEIFTLIAELWNKHKEAIKNGTIINDDKKNDDDNDNKDSSDDDNDIKASDNSTSDDDIKEEKKEPSKGGKAPRKALGSNVAPKKKGKS
jgi:hypothetical protein